MMNIEEKQKMLKDYEDSLKDKTLQELEKIEETLIAEADANDAEVSQMEFDLPEENYPAVAQAVRKLINKQTVQWQYTLGLVGIYDFWNPDERSEKIPYAQLDAVLRTLGQMQFTGYDEWSAVVIINKFFEPLHNAYADATEKTYDIASKHQLVMQAMENIKKLPEDPNAADNKN